jgi:hypothetical protein
LSCAAPRPRARRTALGVRAPRLPRRRASQGPLKSSPSSRCVPAVRHDRPDGRTAVGPLVAAVCPPVVHAGRGLGPCAALMVEGAPGGRLPYKRRALSAADRCPAARRRSHGRAPANIHPCVAPAKLDSFSTSASPQKPPMPPVSLPGRRLAALGSRGGHRRRSPVCPPHRPLLAPTKPANRAQ